MYKIVWFNGYNYGDNNKTKAENLENFIETAELFVKHKKGIDISNRTTTIESLLSKNDKKLENNISRAKSAITEYALCNDWEYFVTLTIDKTKQDRYDMKKYMHDLGIWIGNYNKKYGTKLSYIIIPEKHTDGATHCHGLFNGVAAESLVYNKNGYLDMPYYFNRFGYISLSPIKNKDACAFYMTKYITKDMTCRLEDLGEHLYYCSRGLKRKEVFLYGDINIDEKYKKAFYSNEFCNILWCDDVPELIKEKFQDRIEYVTSDSDDFNVDRPHWNNKGNTDI